MHPVPESEDDRLTFATTGIGPLDGWVNLAESRRIGRGTRPAFWPFAAADPFSRQSGTARVCPAFLSQCSVNLLIEQRFTFSHTEVSLSS